MIRARRLLPVALALLCLGLLAAPAGASQRQISILQDDAALLGLSERDPEAAMAEIKDLGVDVVRVFISWRNVVPDPETRAIPPGFNPRDPDSPGWEWSIYDAFVERARRNGLKVFLTLAPPQPYWASEQPGKCPHFVGGYEVLGKSCMWKPRADLFGAFAAAAAKRYGSTPGAEHGGNVAYWSIWNEPNLEHYLFPQFKRTRAGVVDVAARTYRKLFISGQRAIARYDRPNRGRVLFGETAAISSPMDTIYAALCLDPEGKPFEGKMRRLQGCIRPKRLPIGGIATHPYAGHAAGSVFKRSFTTDSLPPAYISRLHRVLRVAAKQKRIPRRRGIFLTEAGFQSNPPDTRWGLPLDRQAAAINEAERLYYGDRLVKSIAQFELFDVNAAAVEPEEADVYTTGLRFVDGRAKPSLEAFRQPLVVQRLRRNVVEIWGGLRTAPAGTYAPVQAAAPGGSFEPIAARRVNAAGYFKLVFRRRGAHRMTYRTEWLAPDGEVQRSRVAAAGPRIRYLERSR